MSAVHKSKSTVSVKSKRLGGEVLTAVRDRVQRVESIATREQSFSASLPRSPQPKSTIETTKPAIGADLFSAFKPMRSRCPAHQMQR